MANHKNRLRITVLVLTFCLALTILAFLSNNPAEILEGEIKILTSTGILITDFIALANLGAALINVVLVTLIGLGLAWLVHADFNGYLLAGLFTLAGFSFFGTNPFNITPVIGGVLIFAGVLCKQPLKKAITPMLFGTTLAPVVSQFAFGFDWGWWGVLAGIGLGIVCGILLAALVKHIFSFHLGYNLYNTGTTGGFIATGVYMIMRGFGLEIQPNFFWSTEHTPLLSYLILGLIILMIVTGFAWGGNLRQYKKIILDDGKLPSDYVEKTDLGTTMVNMGVVGLLGLGYVHLVGGDVNGPVLAGILTVIGFGALGKHPRNILPIMLGVYLICFPKIWGHTDPGPLLAALFCTTLAPISGRFGVLVGMIAGALHLPMVMHVADLHGYMNLYNNGFAGGLAMILIIGVIKVSNPNSWKNNYHVC